MIIVADILEWPRDVLIPEFFTANLVPFSRSGGTSLGGSKPSVRTDLGHWMIEMGNVQLLTRTHYKAFDTIAAILGGSAGRVAVPVYAQETTPFINGVVTDPAETTHSDSSPFSDGSKYRQRSVSVVTSGVTALGATTIKLRALNADDDLTGVRFSYRHALYQTGELLDRAGDVQTFRVTPSIRELIPAGVSLEFDEPTCLCRLIDNSGMDRSINPVGIQTVSVKFQEDTDYWARLALGLAV